MSSLTISACPIRPPTVRKIGPPWIVVLEERSESVFLVFRRIEMESEPSAAGIFSPFVFVGRTIEGRPRCTDFWIIDCI